MGYLCANFGLPRPSVLDLGLMYATERDRQTSDSIIALCPRLLVGHNKYYLRTYLLSDAVRAALAEVAAAVGD